MGKSQPQQQPIQGTAAARTTAPAKLRAVQTENKPEQRYSGNQAVTVTRRSGDQRRQKTARNPVKLNADESMRFHIIPKMWWYTAILAMTSLPIASVVARSWPPLIALAATLLGSAFAALTHILVRHERANRDAGRVFQAFAWFSLLVPVVCFGFAMGIWGTSGGLSWPWVVASIVCYNSMSTVMLNERPTQQALCLLLSWGAVAIAAQSLEGFGALALSGLFLAVLARYKSRLNRKKFYQTQARERERNRAEDILRDYEDTGQGWFWETDRRGQLSYVSPSIVKVLQRPEDEVISRPFIELFDLGEDNRDGERTLTFHLSARSSFQELGVRAATPGEERWWSINGRPAYDSFHNFVGFRGSGTDLTEKKRSQENVTRLAQFDSLTGLANRFQTQQTLDKILNSPQEAQRECSVFLLDLDRFKQVNDTLGHPAGDALLKQVAQRLERTVGKDGQVGRLGGDEFKVIIPGRTARERLAQLAQEVIHSLSQPYSIEGQRVVIGASIGIAVSPADGLTAESIIRNSDLALYAAKDGGRGRFHFYSNELHSAAEERSKLEQDLRDAIANGALELYYQPVVYAQDDKIAGFEALLRWNHPTKGWLSPAKFIPIAEDTGLISAIGEWAIRTACNDLANWPENIRCAVNVSPLQFANPQLPSVVTNAIARAGVDPSRLELEITESVFLNDDAGTDAMFTALKRVGVRLALDDFGTGYSSLGYLKKAPFDKIKIDQSFVRGATRPGSRNGAIITSITSLAKSLGMDTTAEGVETLDELDLVRQLGCSHIQGYIYSKAIDFESASQLLAAGPNMVAKGPRSARAARHTMLRKIMLEHAGQYYKGTIRNISPGGAMIEGLWNVPPGTQFNIAISETLVIAVTSIWGDEDRTGVKFSEQLDLEKSGLGGRDVSKTQVAFSGETF